MSQLLLLWFRTSVSLSRNSARASCSPSPSPILKSSSLVKQVHNQIVSMVLFKPSLCLGWPFSFVCLVNSFKIISNVTSSVHGSLDSSVGLCTPYCGLGRACFYYESYYICICNYLCPSPSLDTVKAESLPSS